MPQVSEDRFTDVLAQQLAANRYLSRFRKVNSNDMTGVIDHLLEYCALWASGHDEEKLADCRDFLTKVCFAMSIPVLEAAYAMYSLRDGLLENFDGQHGPCKNVSRETIAQFFDLLAMHLMRGH